MDFDKFKDKKKVPALKFKKRKTKRTITKTEGILPENAKSGKVIAVIGTNILIDTKQENFIECSTSGNITTANKNQTLITVGDIVYYLPSSNEDNKGSIIKVETRKNHLSRKEVGYEKEDVLAANIDKLIIMMSADSPPYNKRLIDRYIVSAELNSIEPIICINKIDLLDIELIVEDLQIYFKLGIKIFLISAKHKIGLDNVKNELKDCITVLSGPSGSGKSTLINTILEQDLQPIQITSIKTKKGKHTTSFTRMFPTSNNGYLIDTPGVREFAIWGLEKYELALYFHEFDEYNPKCKYYPCSHIHEPECAVIAALEEGKLDFDRYESYINMSGTL
jgi:ribosome biogenesis GTPase